MANDLGRIKVERRLGDERFLSDGHDLGFDLLSFWQWNTSDLVSNATRGVLAEYIVARALGVDVTGVRGEWAAYDLTAPSGLKIEVKSAAYLQSWSQRELSRIEFSTRKTRTWDPETNRQAKKAARHADVYVYALLAHQEKKTLNPLDVSQWEFYVLTRTILDARKRSQYSITLKSLRGIAQPVKYEDLRASVRCIVKRPG
jgi:hypothetical protein